MIRKLLIVGVAGILMGFGRLSFGQEPGWWGAVVAPEPTRSSIEQTPIVHRPYRPFHFYGNTVRRMYYRGNPLPQPRDVREAVRALRRGPTSLPVY